MSKKPVEKSGLDFDLLQVSEICREHATRKGDLLVVLQKIQAVYGYVPKEALAVVAETLDATTSEIYGVLTFYNRFHLSPRGRHTIRACRGTACHFKGAGEIIETIRKMLRIEDAHDTTADAEFSLEEVACLGACGIAPVIMVDEDTFGNLSPSGALDAVDRYGPTERNGGKTGCGTDTDRDESDGESLA
jgi:NADH-quinone oxidoreductase subunit E